MIDIAIIGGIGTIVALGAYAAYSYWKTGEVDDETVDTIRDEAEDVMSEAEVDEELSELDDLLVEEDSEENAVAPKRVVEMGSHEDIHGIGPSKALTLEAGGFGAPVDLWYASDNALLDTKDIGPATVDTIREDIGGIDYE